MQDLPIWSRVVHPRDPVTDSTKKIPSQPPGLGPGPGSSVVHITLSLNRTSVGNGLYPAYSTTNLSSNTSPAPILPSQSRLVRVHFLPDPATLAAGLRRLVTSLSKVISRLHSVISASGLRARSPCQLPGLSCSTTTISLQSPFLVQGREAALLVTTQDTHRRIILQSMLCSR